MISTIKFDNCETIKSEYTIYAINEANSDFLFLTTCLLDFQNNESLTKSNKTAYPAFYGDDPEYFKTNLTLTLLIK